MKFLFVGSGNWYEVEVIESILRRSRSLQSIVKWDMNGVQVMCVFGERDKGMINEAFFECTW